MKRLATLLPAVAGFLLLLASCHSGSTSSTQTHGDTIPLKYARLITLIEQDSFNLVVMQNPWKPEKILHRYVLVDKNRPLPEQLPEGTVIRTPVERAVVYSSVHYSLLELLQATDCVDGVCDAEYMLNPELQKKLQNGSVRNYGNSMSPNIEQIMEQHPEILMPSPFEQSGSYGKLGSLGIPIVECADYMEGSALGRAEWMRFYGMLFGKEHQADSLFQSIEAEYNRLKKLAAGSRHKPSLLCEMKTGANWFVPGGNSTSGQLYQDAGARYVFAHLENSGALPLPFEAVLEQAEDAEVWLIKYNQKEPLSYRQLKQDYEPYTRFKAWKDKHIYGCNTRYVPFYEETPFQPQLLLKDLICLLHPDLLPGEKSRYFTPIP